MLIWILGLGLTLIKNLENSLNPLHDNLTITHIHFKLHDLFNNHVTCLDDLMNYVVN